MFANQCSSCGEDLTSLQNVHYCPKCGASCDSPDHESQRLEGVLTSKKRCPELKKIDARDRGSTTKKDLQIESDRERAELLRRYVGDPRRRSKGKYFDYYKLYFDHYVSTRAERTDWNKFFITLLFIQTLVAILTALLGARGIIPSTAIVGATGVTLPESFTQLLIIVIVFVSAAISITWFARLRYMKNLITAEETVLKDMEQALSLPFAGMYREDCAFYEEDNMIGVPLSKLHYLEQQFWVTLNYWLLPLILFVAFVIIGLLLVFFPLTVP